MCIRENKEGLSLLDRGGGGESNAWSMGHGGARLVTQVEDRRSSARAGGAGKQSTP